jgi:NAD+ dependent glucose-6-phosphate dehydrogenase
MRVIITGAAGRIGRQMVEELSDSHDLCLMDRTPVPGRASIVADLAQNHVRSYRRLWPGLRPSRWTEVFQGTNVVLHLAANPSPQAPWQQVLRDNIQATQNVIEAAVKHRVRRVVFASSNWAVKAWERELAPDCYAPGGPKLSSDTPPRPLTFYGISKALGEITGRTFVDEGQLVSFVAVRIGSYHPVPPTSEEWRRLWIGAQDLRSLLRRCVEAEFTGSHVVYGVSAQPTIPYDLSHTGRLLSWEPRQLL